MIITQGSTFEKAVQQVSKTLGFVALQPYGRKL